MSKRLIVLKTVLWALTGALTVLTISRFRYGLGAITNLSDATPWGLWIALKLVLVATSAGGFVMAGTVYIFGREKYRPWIRFSILSAFLGYVCVAFALMYDLGLPWHIWHPMIYWQHHSALFEVAMCVMAYLAVLAMEFSPVILEHPNFGHPVWRAVLRGLKKATIPLVIAGIVLSSLHQSSLGSLFLIAPHKLHPLWYSPIIYILFFVSAVALGMMVVMLLSLFSSFFYGQTIRRDLQAGLGVAAAVVLSLYCVLRVTDLFVRGVLPSALDGSWQSVTFILEILVSVVVPVVLMSIPRVRHSVAGLTVAAASAVLGMVWHRLNVSVVAIAVPEGTFYFPSWMEFVVSIGILAAAGLAFLFFVERLRVYDDMARTAGRPTSFDPASVKLMAPSPFAAPRRYSLAFITAAAIVVLILPQQAVLGVRPARTPVAPVRAVDGVAVDRGAATVRQLDVVVAGDETPAGSPIRRLLMINGNRNDDLVLFDHDAHMKRVAGVDSCAVCHHINMPLDRASACSGCHRDMYEPTDVFNHTSHVDKLDGNAGCGKCHSDSTEVKTRETATACSHCHEKQIAGSHVIAAPEPRWASAAGYMDAMHGLCIDCHKKAVEDAPADVAAHLPRCDTCHNVDYAPRVARLLPTGDEE